MVDFKVGDEVEITEECDLYEEIRKEYSSTTGVIVKRLERKIETDLGLECEYQVQLENGILTALESIIRHRTIPNSEELNRWIK